MKRFMVGLAVLFVLAVSCAVPAGLVHAQVQAPTARSYVGSLTQAENGIMCSAVRITRGLVLTADHCVSLPGLTLDSGTTPGFLVARGDDRLDIALLAYPNATCPCVRLADSEARVDETVYVIGYPRGIAQVMSIGVSQGVHDNPAMPYGRRLITTAPVAGGNSGGGVFVLRDGEYQLVGILVEMIGNMSFAVPLADIRPFIGARGV
jgi:S1-C subfamily serine protease